MKFLIGEKNELVAEQNSWQPAFVKGAMAAYRHEPEENPYRRAAFRKAWELGYQGIKQGKIIIVWRS